MKSALGLIFFLLGMLNVSFANQVINAKTGKTKLEPVVIRGTVLEKGRNFIKVLVLSSAYKNDIIKIAISNNYKNIINNLKKEDTVLFYFDGESVDKIKRAGD